MLAGARELWINFTRLQMSFASDAAEKKALSEEVVDEKMRLPVSGTLPCHGTVQGNGKVRDGIGGNRKVASIRYMRGRSSAD